MRHDAIVDKFGTFIKFRQLYNGKSGSVAPALQRLVDDGKFGEVGFGVVGDAEDEERAVVVRQAAGAGVLVGGLDDALSYFEAGVIGHDG